MEQKQWNTAKVVGGMALVLIGRKFEGIGLFAKGIYDLEKAYREEHPELEPGIKARLEKALEYYEQTHQDEANRSLHMWGIPLILGGVVGLLASKPYGKAWLFSALSFSGGLLMDFVGHEKFEKKKTTFFNDPISFVAGPIWDIKQAVDKTQIIDHIVRESISENQ